MKLFLYITNPADFMAGGNSFRAIDRESCIPDCWILAGTVEVNIDVDKKTVTEAAIKNLDESEKELRAQFQIRLDAIEESRQKILGIPHLEIA